MVSGRISSNCGHSMAGEVVFHPNLPNSIPLHPRWRWFYKVPPKSVLASMHWHLVYFPLPFEVPNLPLQTLFSSRPCCISRQVFANILPVVWSPIPGVPSISLTVSSLILNSWRGWILKSGHCTKGQGLVMRFKLPVGWWIIGACLWHCSHFHVYSVASFAFVATKTFESLFGELVNILPCDCRTLPHVAQPWVLQLC